MRSRSNGGAVEENMRNHAKMNNGNKLNNANSNNISFSKLKILEQVLKMIKNDISSNVVENEDKQNSINSHNLSKRSPGCLLWCLKIGILHPAQCHSYCRFSG